MSSEEHSYWHCLVLIFILILILVLLLILYCIDTYIDIDIDIGIFIGIVLYGKWNYANTHRKEEIYWYWLPWHSFKQSIQCHRTWTLYSEQSRYGLFHTQIDNTSSFLLNAFWTKADFCNYICMDTIYFCNYICMDTIYLGCKDVHFSCWSIPFVELLLEKCSNWIAWLLVGDWSCFSRSARRVIQGTSM